jgi:hypothetical protein
LKEKISLTTKSGSSNEKRTALRAELDSIRSHQSANKASRAKIFDQLKTIQDNMQKKVQSMTILFCLSDAKTQIQAKDLQATKSKIPFKSVAEVDAQIKSAVVNF